MKNYILNILLIVVVILITGCFIDNKNPSIDFDSVYKIDKKYYKYYTGDVATITGVVSDNKRVAFLKNDGEIIERTKEGKFIVILYENRSQTEFSARDLSGNLKKVDVILKRDNSNPVIGKIKLNSRTYVDNMVFGNEEEILLEVEAIDDNYIKEVTCNSEPMDYNEKNDIYYLVLKKINSGINNLKIEVKDGADNYIYKNLIFIYDETGPQIVNVKINGDNYSDNMKYGVKDIKVTFNLMDDSMVQKIYVDEKDMGLTTYFDYVLKDGENKISIKAYDMYDNGSEKILTINYVEGTPNISNIYLKNSGGLIEKYNDKYYVNSKNLILGGSASSGNSNVKLKELYFNRDKIADFSSATISFEENVVIGDDITQIIPVEIINEAYLAMITYLDITFDNTFPEININPDKDIFYSDESKISLDELFSVTVTDNIGIKSLDYYVNSIKIEKSTKFDITDENIIKIVAIDYANNKTEKTVMLNSDKSGPKIINIKLNNIDYYDNIQYGEKIIKVTFDLIDESPIIDFRVNGVSTSNMEYFYYSLESGENIITLEAEDSYKNKTLKKLYIEYIEGMPEIIIKKIYDYSDDVYYRDGFYYTNQSVVNLYLEMYSGSDSVNLKTLYINNDKIDLESQTNVVIEYPIHFVINGLNTYDIILENESHIKKEDDAKIIFDTEKPVIETIPSDNKVYVNLDNIKIENYLEVNITDNSEKIKYIKYYLDNILIEPDEIVEVRDNSVLEIKVEDYAGNTETKVMYIEKDTVKPVLHSVIVNNTFQKVDILNWDNKIIIPHKNGDDKNLKIHIETYDEKTAIKSVKYGDEIVPNNEFIVDVDDVKDLIIEDYAGNKLIKEIEIIKFNELNFKYGANMNGVYNLNVNEYYIGAATCNLSYNVTKKIKMWLDTTNMGDEYIKEGSIQLKHLTEGINEKKIYIEDEENNRAAYYFTMYYDLEPPYIDKTEILIDDIKYYDNMHIITSDKITIKLAIDDVSGIGSVEIPNSIFVGKDGNVYTYRINKDNLTDGTNLISVTLTDKIGNNREEILHINITKINSIVLNIKEISERFVRLTWTKPNVNFKYNYRIYVEELTPNGDKFNRVLEQNDYIVWDLNDNTSYQFKVKLEGEEFIGEIYSNTEIVKTINATPIKINFTDIKTYTKNEDIYFKLSWEKIDPLDEHDFSNYEISVSEDDKVYKVVTKITNKEVCEFDYMIPRVKNSDPAALYEYVKNDNKLYYFKLKAEDKGKLYSTEVKISEFSYNLAPDIDKLNFNFVKKIVGTNYSVEIDFNDISNEIDLTEYRIFRINHSNNEQETIVALSTKNGKTVKNVLKENIILEENLVFGRVKIKDNGVKLNNEYSYLMEVQDTNKDVHKNSSDDKDMVSEYETETVVIN